MSDGQNTGFGTPLRVFRLAFARGNIQPEGEVFNSLKVFNRLGAVRRC
jgi:hypothetical protein